MHAAIYARFSSDSQRPQSIVDQLRECREEAQRRGWEVVSEFSDAALSGQLGEDQRPGFGAMMKAAKRGAFDVLLVDDASRLSRDGPEAQIALRLLDFMGIKFVARADGIDTAANPKSSRLLYGIKAAMNEEFLRDLAEKTHRGLEGAARKGFSTGGLPYGYRSQPVFDERGQIVGHQRVIHEAEAAVVRRIFRLYAGDEGDQHHSGRQIAVLLNEEGIAPPAARWSNRTVRQARTWSCTAIIGHRRMRKGILNNPIYVGQLLWNRSEWRRHPITKRITYRLRPKDDWVTVAAPELRIVDDDLSQRVQVRLALHDVPRSIPGRRNVGKYLLSGFVRCAVCGGAYIKTNHSYRCGTHRNRGDVACTNSLGVTTVKLERIVLAALRERLYTPENLGRLVAAVRDKLLARARQEAAAPAADPDRAKRLREVEREIENIKAAVRLGKATSTLLEMLEEAERRKATLAAGQEPRGASDVVAKLERVLADLPGKVRACLDDLETLLTGARVEEGKQILAGLGTEIVIRSDGTAEIRGDLRKALLLVAAKRGRESAVLWLGEEDSNPR